MKIKYIIEELSSTRKIYVLWKRLENTNSFGFSDRVGTTFEEVIAFTRKLIVECFKVKRR